MECLEFLFAISGNPTWEGWLSSRQTSAGPKSVTPSCTGCLSFVSITLLEPPGPWASHYTASYFLMIFFLLHCGSPECRDQALFLFRSPGPDMCDIWRWSIKIYWMVGWIKASFTPIMMMSSLKAFWERFLIQWWTHLEEQAPGAGYELFGCKIVGNFWEDTGRPSGRWRADCYQLVWKYFNVFAISLAALLLTVGEYCCLPLLETEIWSPPLPSDRWANWDTERLGSLSLDTQLKLQCQVWTQAAWPQPPCQIPFPSDFCPFITCLAYLCCQALF